jgi:hypothetical protein
MRYSELSRDFPHFFKADVSLVPQLGRDFFRFFYFIAPLSSIQKRLAADVIVTYPTELVTEDRIPRQVLL